MAVRLNHRIHAAEVQKASAAFLCVLVAQKLTKCEAEKDMKVVGYMRVNSIKLCPHRFTTLWRLWAGVQKSHMVQKWQKEDCVAV